MKKRNKIILITTLILGGVIFILFITGALGGLLFIASSTLPLLFSPWHGCLITYPGQGPEITFFQKQAHPFFAEFEYRLTVDDPDTGKVDYPLIMNTGGDTKVDVYWHPFLNNQGPFLRLIYQGNEYLIRLNLSNVFRIKRFYEADELGRRYWLYLIDENGNEFDENEEIFGDMEDFKAEMYLGQINYQSGKLELVQP